MEIRVKIGASEAIVTVANADEAVSFLEKHSYFPLYKMRPVGLGYRPQNFPVSCFNDIRELRTIQ